MSKRASGFTIIELLIVIVIIAILAAITIVAYNGIQDRARAGALVTDLKKIEKAFRLYGIDRGWTTWAIDNSSSLTGSGNPNVNTIITSQAEFANYLQKLNPASYTGDSSAWYEYDNDVDTYNSCSQSSGGVNIYLMAVVSQSIAQDVDNAIDDGNFSCGRVTWDSSTGHLRYNLSTAQAF